MTLQALNRSEVIALARSALTDPAMAERWLNGELVPNVLAARLAKVYRALGLGSPPIAAISTLPDIVA